jgi:hypothetical protein
VKLEQARQDALDAAARGAVENARGAAEAASLNRRIAALDKTRGAMIERESSSLAELEREEGLNSGPTTNVALESVFDEQQLAAFLKFPGSSGFSGDRF